jgi:signal transduction histidine kinase
LSGAVLRRLYLQIYLTVVACLVFVVLTAGALWRLTIDVSPVNQAFEMAGALAAAALPAADAPIEAQRRAIILMSERLHVAVALYRANRELIAAVGAPLPAPNMFRGTGGWLYGSSGAAWAIRLPDGRWLIAGVPFRHRHPGLALIGFLGGVGLIVTIAAFPIARRITRRLERLQTGVESLGAGDLTARVKVEGRDEVAHLAASFNNAAARIEVLVKAHKMLLANASHELRTPLTRIRLGIELLKSGPDPRHQAQLERDIAELDLLIDEILLASRLDAVGELDSKEAVDLLALAAEEAARYEHCTVTGAPVLVRGDRHLLMRMIRNLIENAQRHGKPPIEFDVRPRNGSAVLRILDHGAPIATSDRERIFEPFFRAPGSAAPERGAGLGLALVRQIARRHKGEAVYEADAAGRNCFVVTLPAATG